MIVTIYFANGESKAYPDVISVEDEHNLVTVNEIKQLHLEFPNYKRAVFNQDKIQGYEVEKTPEDLEREKREFEAILKNAPIHWSRDDRKTNQSQIS